MYTLEEVSHLVKALCGDNYEKTSINIQKLVYFQNDIKTVKILLDINPNYINYQQNGSSTLISHSRSPEMFRMLYDMGANLEIKDNLGRTPIDIIRNNLKHKIDGSLYNIEKVYEEIMKERFKQNVLDVLNEIVN